MPAQPSETEIDEWVRLGGMAPSGGNAQPWRVVLRPHGLELRLDPARASAFLDVERIASSFAAGCFLENLCLAATAGGWSVDVCSHEQLRPSDALATVLFGAQTGALPRDPLYAQISRRHTNRRFHEGPPLEEAVTEQLRQAIGEREDVRLCAISEPAQKRQAAAHLGRGDAIFLRHSQLFNGMLSELRWTATEADRTRDGVAIHTLELPGAAVKLLHALRRWPPLRRLLPTAALRKMPEAPVLGCSHFCSLSVSGVVTRQTALSAGRAAQRVWLCATELGLAVQPLAALPFMLLRATHFGGVGFDADDRRELDVAGAGLRALFGLGADEFPLFLFRLSRAAPASDRALRLSHEQLYLRQ